MGLARVPGADSLVVEVSVAAAPAYSLAYVHLAAGESVFAEKGSMVALSAGMEVNASVDGGVVRAAMRKALVRESFFFTRFRAQVHDAWVALAPRFPGDVEAVGLSSTGGLLVQSGSLLAYGEDVDVVTRVGSLPQMVMREGATVMRASGTGKVLLCSYGGIQRFEVQAGQQMVVDSGHLVAWSEGMDMRVGPLSGVVSQALTGEGLVCAFTGPGLVFIQTRAEQQLMSWLFPQRAHDSR